MDIRKYVNIMKKLFALICGFGLMLGAVSCNPSNDEDTGLDIDLTATAWVTGSGNLAINFLQNNGISVVNMKHVFIQGTYTRNKNKFDATFTYRIDNYDDVQHQQASELNDPPMQIGFTFTVREDKNGEYIATVSAADFPGHSGDEIMIQVR